MSDKIYISSQDNQVNLSQNNNIVVITDSDQNQITVTQPVTAVLEINTPGPPGPPGPQGPPGTGSFDTGSFATTGSNNFIGTQTINGNLTITGSTAGTYGTISRINFVSGAAIVVDGPNMDLVAGPEGWSELASNNGENYVWVDNEGVKLVTGWNTSAHQWLINLSGSLNAAGDLNMNGNYITGSISGSLTGSLLGTSSYSNQSLSSSYALTASYLDNYIAPFPYTGSAIITGSLVVTGSIRSTNGFTGSLQGTSSFAITASTSITESRTITFNLGSIPTPITTGSKTNNIFYSPYSGSIKGFILTSNTSSTTTLDIWKRNNTLPTSSDTIITTNKPQLINNQFTSSYNVSGWTTLFNPNDVFLINVETNTSASNLTLQLITEIYK
jgi:hypothetical protein